MPRPRRFRRSIDAAAVPVLAVFTVCALGQVGTAGSAAEASTVPAVGASVDCRSGRLPDRGCTPGSSFQTSAGRVCVSGYSRSVRNVPASEKRQVYDEYGIHSHVRGEYEVDHLVPLELGGDNSVRNLWPEAAQPRPGFHEKDRLENTLHDLVCAGRMTLRRAQSLIAGDWVTAFKRYR